MADVVVIGGGVGGMAAALRLRAAGHDVVLCERRDELGGKLGELRRDGYTFSVGPSLLTWPEMFTELLAVAGRRLDDVVDVVPVDPIMRYRFDDGSGFDARTDLAATAAEVEAMAPGQGQRWLDYLEWSRTCWLASVDSFFAGPIDRLADLRRGNGDPRDVLAVDPLRTLAARARTSFDDPRLQMYAARYATYSGSNPYRAPAALGCIPYLEHRYGAWYVTGGIVRLRDALERVLREAGVDVRTGCAVSGVHTDGSKVTGVELADGQTLRADVVVSDVDAKVLYETLLPPRQFRGRAVRRRYRGRSQARSSSALLILAAVRGRTPSLAHHNVFFTSDYRAEFAEIFDRDRPPSEPTIYLGCSVVDDPGQAPQGNENWSLLVNVPPGDHRSWPYTLDAYRDLVFERLAHFGLDVSSRLEFAEIVTPADVGQRDGSGDGAIYGTAAHGRLAPLRRPGNRGPVEGLYLVGGSTHPGGGLPLVVKSAQIVADLIAEEHR